jgi:hypothetical protein
MNTNNNPFNHNSTLRAMTADNNHRHHTTEASKNDELRKSWQVVLRDCHRLDPERTGQVSRNVFISSIEKANIEKVFLFFLFIIIFFCLYIYIFCYCFIFFYIF